MEKTLRHRIVESGFTLPVTATLCTAAWLLPDLRQVGHWLTLAAALLTAYLLMELNNRNQLLHIRSRMVSVVFLSLSTAAAFLHLEVTDWVPAFSLIAVYTLLFRSYQETHPEGVVFYAFAVLMMGAYFFPPLIVLTPTILLSMAVQLRSLTWRTFAAALFGLTAPLWGYAVWAVWKTDPLAALDFVRPYLQWERPDYASVPLWAWVNAGFLLFHLFLALLHYYRTNFNDKIRVRMYFYVMIVQAIPLLAGLALYPTHYNVLFALLIANSAPLIGHYYALARGRLLMTLWFLFNVMGLVAMAIYNYGVVN